MAWETTSWTSWSLFQAPLVAVTHNETKTDGLSPQREYANFVIWLHFLSFILELKNAQVVAFTNPLCKLRKLRVLPHFSLFVLFLSAALKASYLNRRLSLAGEAAVACICMNMRLWVYRAISRGGSRGREGLHKDGTRRFQMTLRCYIEKKHSVYPG